MSYAKHLLLVSLPAAAANLGLMFVWIEVLEGWTDLNKLIDQPLVQLLAVYGVAYLITAFGLALLVLLASPLLSHVTNRMLTVPAFIFLGGLLGGCLFAWSDPYLGGSWGAVSAVFCVLLAPGLFGEVTPELPQDGLAD
jgi:hypothetical protein